MFILHRILLVPKAIHLIKWRNIVAAGGHLGLIRGITIGRVYEHDVLSVPNRYHSYNMTHPNKSTNGLMSF